MKAAQRVLLASGLLLGGANVAMAGSPDAIQVSQTASAAANYEENLHHYVQGRSKLAAESLVLLDSKTTALSLSESMRAAALKTGGDPSKIAAIKMPSDKDIASLKKGVNEAVIIQNNEEIGNGKVCIIRIADSPDSLNNELNILVNSFDRPEIPVGQMPYLINLINYHEGDHCIEYVAGSSPATFLEQKSFEEHADRAALREMRSSHLFGVGASDDAKGAADTWVLLRKLNDVNLSVILSAATDETPESETLLKSHIIGYAIDGAALPPETRAEKTQALSSLAEKAKSLMQKTLPDPNPESEKTSIYWFESFLGREACRHA